TPGQGSTAQGAGPEQLPVPCQERRRCGWAIAVAAKNEGRFGRTRQFVARKGKRGGDMRKVVGTLFVAAVLASGSRAQAEPMHLGQFSGLDFQQDHNSQGMWTADDNAAAWSRFTTEVRERLSTCQ